MKAVNFNYEPKVLLFSIMIISHKRRHIIILCLFNRGCKHRAIRSNKNGSMNTLNLLIRLRMLSCNPDITHSAVLLEMITLQK